jgi:hypothetical protein
MKRFLLFLLALLAACPLLFPANSRAQQSSSAAPPDASAVLSTLKELRAKQEQAMKNTKAQVLANINAAAADNSSAGKTYEQAMIAVEFQGQGAPGAKLTEWRKKQGDMLRNRDFLTAARLQLVYLSLTWQRSSGVKARDLLPALYDYTAQVDNSRDAIEPFENTLKRSLPESVFTAYYQVGPFISGLPEWEMQQFNTEGIFQKTILPELRRMKDARVLDYWDRRLQMEAIRAERAQTALVSNRFERIRKPTLLWNRAEDALLLGDKTRAVNDMLALAKKYSDHPDFEKWAARLEEIVSGEEPKEPSPAS